MIVRLNYFINLVNLFLIFIYFIFTNITLVNKKFEYLIISLILLNLLIKLHNWYKFNFSKKGYLPNNNDNIFFNDRFIKLSILIFSIVTPIYMIFQKDSLVIDLFIEKLSFLMVFIFALLGFFLEFFFLESKPNK